MASDETTAEWKSKKNNATDDDDDVKNSNDESVVVISDETSNRVCTHMNDDHAVSVYAMAKKLLMTTTPTTTSIMPMITTKGGAAISSMTTTMMRVTKDGCEIRIRILRCTGGGGGGSVAGGSCCQLDDDVYVFYPFDPPLTSGTELRSRLVSIHHGVCMPPIFVYGKEFLFNEGIVMIIVSTLITVLGYCTLIMEPDILIGHIEYGTNIIRDSSLLSNYGISLLDMISIDFIATYFIKGIFYITILAHILEAIYGFYHSKYTLKLTWMNTTLWTFLMLIFGLTFTKELYELVKVHQKQILMKKNENNNKKKKKES